MKTLSVRQPWADLIIQGEKTLELRSWTVKYRGPLAIHASQTVEREACAAHGLDPDQVTAGAVIGVVDLVGIEALDSKSFAARRGEHLASDLEMKPPLYGWRLANPRPLAEPVPMHGRMGLFDAPVSSDGFQVAGDELRGDNLPIRQPETRNSPTRNMPTRNTPTRNFELRVLPDPAAGPGGAPYRLALYQRRVEPPPDQRGLYEAERPPMQPVAELGGMALRVVAEQVIEALRRGGYKPTDLSASRREPFILSEETGVRLGLLFLGIRPLTKVARIEAIAQGIRAMTDEEAYYWYAKCVAGPAAERAQRALRVLLAEE